MSDIKRYRVGPDHLTAATEDAVGKCINYDAALAAIDGLRVSETGQYVSPVAITEQEPNGSGFNQHGTGTNP